MSTNTYWLPDRTFDPVNKLNTWFCLVQVSLQTDTSMQGKFAGQIYRAPVTQGGTELGCQSVLLTCEPGKTHRKEIPVS